MTHHLLAIPHFTQQSTSDDGKHDSKDDKAKVSPSKLRDSPLRQSSSPTLAELNTDPPRAKRPAYSASYSPPPNTQPHPYSTAISDSSSPSLPPPRQAFSDREGLDELSSSFRSLYKSIFGQSLAEGAYLNADILPHIPNQELNCSDGSSIPLGGSASNLLGAKANHSEFLSLMDSFRDIADAKTWDKLDPAHVQGLLESFKAGQSNKFGLDPQAYANVHASFNQFVSQLSNRFLATSSLNNYGHHRDSGLGEHALLGHHNGTPHNYQVDTGVISPVPLLGMNQSSPTDYNRTPSPHHMNLMNQGHLHPVEGGSQLPSHYGLPYTPTLSSLAETPNHHGMKTSLDHLLDDDDDFDWSKLM